MSNCLLCHGTGIVLQYTASAVTVGPCPNCNESLKKKRKHEFDKMRQTAQWRKGDNNA